MNNNLDQLITAARLLRPLLDELVFVGGAVTGLLLTDEAAAEPRSTLDVDAIAEITMYAEYAVFGDRLRALGFSEDTREDAPLCRWVNRTTTLFFLATKPEAFKGRGQNDFFGSHDLEDLVTVVDGRASLIAEVREANADLRACLRDELSSLLASQNFQDALPGYLLPDAATQARIPILLRRLETLASV